jgi:hemolysin D
MPQSSFNNNSDRWSYVIVNLVNELPKAWTRGLLYFLTVFIAIILPWAMLYKVEETGTARGKLELKGNTVKQESDLTEAVAVSAIHVREGDLVKKGQILLELDSKAMRDRLQQSQVKLESQENRMAQSDILKNQLLLALNTQKQQSKAQELEKQTQINQARQNLSTVETVYTLKNKEGLAAIEQAQQSLRDSQTAYNLAHSVWQDDLQEIKRYQEAQAQGVVAETQVNEIKKQGNESLKLRNQALFDIKQARLKLQAQQNSYQAIIHQAKSNIRQAQLRLEEQQRNYQSLIESGKVAVSEIERQLGDLETQIASLQGEISQTQTEIKSLNRQLGKYIIRAPFDGTLFQFPTATAEVIVRQRRIIDFVLDPFKKLQEGELRF